MKTFQFSLRRLMLAVTLIAVGCSLFTQWIDLRNGLLIALAVIAILVAIGSIYLTIEASLHVESGFWIGVGMFLLFWFGLFLYAML